MDLLSSLNLHVLPEQQTRINDKISKCLQENPNIRLGFDACCNCANPLKNSDKDDVCCKGCRRVWYCSKECRREDAQSSHNHISGEEEQAGGHSAVVCSLLRLCNIDEEVENDICKNNKGKIKSRDQNRESLKEKQSLSSSKSSSATERKIKFSDEERKASMDRISSEYESYPATLNVLMDAPCFESALEKFMLRRRGKKTRQHGLDESEQVNDKNTLTIHIIGASMEAELWGDFQMDQTDAMSAYTDALSELSSTYRGLRKIVLAFVGPNCPKEKKRVVKYIDGADVEGHEEASSAQTTGKKRKRDGGKHCQVVIETHRHNYEMKYFKLKETSSSSSSSKKKGKHHHHHSHLSKPDVVIFFNPGFTCPDYQWHEALNACRNGNKDTSESTQTPFIVTTNTEMEAIADIQYLHQHGYIDSLPPAVADIVNEGQLDHDSDTFDQNANNSVFFGENINAGNRVRQSGNMANDLFCKNKYIFGGHFAHHCEKRKKKESNMDASSSSRNSTIESKTKLSSSTKVKKRSNSMSSNSKKNNAALM